MRRFPFMMATVLAMGTSVPAATNYVWQDSPNPTPPFSSWETAAHVIQDAVNAAGDGDTVLVTNGVYRTGGKVVDGTTNRVAVDKLLHLMSVNGPEVTIIDGRPLLRCVYLTNNTTLTGFTLTNGWAGWRGSGGGVFCESTSALVSDCVLTRNIAPDSGGGTYGGTLINCILRGNSAPAGGGVSESVAFNCEIGNSFAGFFGEGKGGGAFRSTLYNCVVVSNVSSGGGIDGRGAGGGAYDCTLYNSILIGNSVSAVFGDFGGGAGGGAVSSTLYNCTVTANWASDAGGVANSTLTNCIVLFNTAPDQPNYDATTTVHYTCTYPMPADGVGNITNAPLFVDTNNWADLRLLPNSPCIDAGNNDFVTSLTDLDGKPRILNGIVDMGAYEFVPLSPAELVLQLAEMVANSDLSHKRPLLASLQAALASIERGSHHSAMGQLGAFQNKVAAQVYRHDPEFAVELMYRAEEARVTLEDNR